MSPSPLESGEEAQKAPENSQSEEERLYGTDLTADKDGGVRKIVLKKGIGEEKASSGCTVVVSYVGRFLNGEEFDSNAGGTPFEFVLGEGVVIRGWDIGLATMKKGEKAVLTCQSPYAYGEQGGSKIPPNSVLQFTIELLDWKGTNVTANGEVSKIVLTKGDGYDRPNTGAHIEAHITGRYEGRVFEDRDVTFTFGEGSEAGLLDGVEEAIGKMIKKETAKVFIKPGFYSFGPQGKPEWGIPPDGTIVYNIEIKNCEKFKEAWELSNPEKIATALRVKEKGTKFFKEGKYKIACRLYSVVVKMLDGYFDEEEHKECDPIKIAGYLNMAACHLKLGSNFKCIKACEKALEIDKENIKAVYRRGKARFTLKDYDNAKVDFSLVLDLDPKNREARAQLRLLNQKLKEHHVKERKIFANMFERLAHQEAKEKEETEKKRKVDNQLDVFQEAMEEAKRLVDDEEQQPSSTTPTGDEQPSSTSEVTESEKDSTEDTEMT